MDGVGLVMPDQRRRGGMEEARVTFAFGCAARSFQEMSKAFWEILGTELHIGIPGR